MMIKVSARNERESIQLTIQSFDVATHWYLDIKEAEILKAELTLALQSYDEYMADLDNAANEFMEKG